MEPHALKDLINAQREELIQKYFPQDKSLLSKLLPDDSYEKTSDLVSHAISFGQQYIIRSSTLSAILNLIFIHGVQLLILFLADKEFRLSFIHIILQILFTLGAVALWAKLLNSKKPQVIIDNTGIENIPSGYKIEWNTIALTYLRTRYSKTTTTYLVINYYAPWNNYFEEKEIDLTYLDTTNEAISSAIEYYKKTGNNQVE
jgi:hypothetical protein